MKDFINLYIKANSHKNFYQLRRKLKMLGFDVSKGFLLKRIKRMRRP